MKKRINSLLIFLFCVTCFGWVCLAGDEPEESSSTNIVSLEQFAQKYGVFFTIEDTTSSRLDYQNPILTLTDTKDSATFPTQLLAAAFPQYIIQRSTTNDRIIHLIAKELYENPKYTLSKKLSDFTYFGKASGLISSISEQDPLLKPADFSRVGAGPVEARNDYWTLCRITATNATIRAILTDSIDLTSYYWLVWVARTDETGKTTVRYLGQTNSKEARKAMDYAKEYLSKATNGAASSTQKQPTKAP